MADSGFGRFQSTCACETLVTKHCSKALKSSVNVQIGHGEWALSGLSSRFFLCLMCFAYPQRHRTLEEFTYAFSPAGHAPHYPHQFCRTVSSSNFRLCQNDTLGEADPADPLSTCSILPFWLSHLLLRSCKMFLTRNTINCLLILFALLDWKPHEGRSHMYLLLPVSPG